MSKSENESGTFRKKVVEMIKDPRKIITKPIEIVKMYTEDSTIGRQRRSKLKDYAIEHPVKTAALAGVIVASGAAVATAALVSVPLLFVASPVVAAGFVGAVAFGSSLAFRTASETLHNLARENREQSGPFRKAGMSRRDTKTLVKFEALNQEILVDEHKSKEQVSQSKIEQVLENGGNAIVQNLKNSNIQSKSQSNSNKSSNKDLRKYYLGNRKKNNVPSH